MATDDELLQIEIETLWVLDAHARLLRVRRPDAAPAPWLVLAFSPTSCIAAVRNDIPQDLAARFREYASQTDAVIPNETIERCHRLLTDTMGPLALTSGPSYLIPPTVSFASAVQMHRSSDAGHDSLPDSAPPESGWSPEEWRALLDSAFGPWAIATVDGHVASICHSARLAPRGAEAGVWTDERFRGSGLAAAVTAAWAALLAPTGRHLFYSTSAENLSSQRVAARLNLRPIGSTWRFDPLTTNA